MSSIVSKEDYLKIVVKEDDKRLWGDTRLTPGYLAALDNMRRSDLEEWLLRQERVINKHCDDLEQKFHQQTQEAFSDAQQSLPDHVKKVLQEKSLSSTRIKNPSSLRMRAGELDFRKNFREQETLENRSGGRAGLSKVSPSRQGCGLTGAPSTTRTKNSISRQHLQK